MTLIPPSFSFKGDRQKSISLKAQARQFYNFIVNQAELGGISFINRSLVLSDGSIISVTFKKESIYGHRTGTVNIISSSSSKPVITNIREYITVMSPTGTSSGYPNTDPPGVYQSISDRIFYKNDTTDTTVPKSFFGAKDFPTESWSNKQNYNVAWTRYTIYINGYYCSIRSLILSLVISNSWYDVSILKAVISDNQLLLMIKWTRLSPPYSGRQFLRFDFSGVGTPGVDSFTLSYNPEPTDSTILSGEVDEDYESQFTASSRTYITSSLNPTTFVQKIDKLSFDQSFTALTKTTIYSETVGGHTEGASVSEISGAPLIVKLQAEDNSFGLIRSDVSGASGTSSGTGLVLNTYLNIQWSLEVCSLSSEGLLAIKHTLPVYSGTEVSFSGTLTTSGGGGYQIYADSDITITDVYVIAFNSKVGGMCYEHTITTYATDYRKIDGVSNNYTETISTNRTVSYSYPSTTIPLLSFTPGYSSYTYIMGTGLYNSLVSTITSGPPSTSSNIRPSHPPVSNNGNCRGVAGNTILLASSGDASVLINLTDPSIRKTYPSRVDTFNYNPMLLTSSTFQVNPA